MNNPAANPAASPGSPGEAALHCLVTGGAGFIGSHLVDHLLAGGARVTVVDNLSTGRESNLAPARARAGPRLRFVRADLGAAITSELASERFGQIYHLAAAVGVRRIIERPIESIESNVLDTSAVLRYAASHGPSGGPAPTLIASSSEVYGKSPKSPFHEDDDCLYGPTTAFRWSYAASKAIDEYLALAHHAQNGLPVLVARFFNTVGPRQVGDYGMVLPAFVASALAGRPLDVYGDGRQTRCFCDVRDVVPALPRLLAAGAIAGVVANVGSERPISIMELAELVVKTLQSRSAIRSIPYDRAYAPGFEDLRQRRPDLGRLRSLINFEPRITLEQTIRAIADDLAPAGVTVLPAPKAPAAP